MELSQTLHLSDVGLACQARNTKSNFETINRAPSFGTDQKIDYDVKKGVLLNALKLLNIRASDKKRNLAQQKAEAQRRLYGHGSVKKLSAATSDREKQRQTLERRREELKERLAQVRKQISREEHERRHLGNYRRIYPPDDEPLLERYEKDILDLLEQCELDDEKLTGKSSRQRGPKPLSSMPESSQMARRRRPDYLGDFTTGSSANNSCSSSDEDGDGDGAEEMGGERCGDDGGGGRGGGGGGRRGKREKKVSYDLTDSGERSPAERSGRVNWKPPIKPLKPSPTLALSGPIRRSISCPRSMASLSSPNDLRTLSTKPSPTFPLATPLVRPSSATLRSHSLSRSGSAHRVPHSNSLGTIHSHMGDPVLNLRSKEQEAELVRQTLAALTVMRIRFPGKTEEEAEAVLDEILDNWKYHKPKVASYWLVKLDSTKQRKMLDIVRTNVRAALQRVWREPDVESLHIHRLFSRVFGRLLWSHGQGLWNCFSNTGSSWESVFSKSSEVVSPQELQCCRRLVQLCRDCLLVVYKFVSESRGSMSGLSPEWDDTSLPLAAGPASAHGTAPAHDSAPAAAAAAAASASSSSSSSVTSPRDAGTGTLLAGAASLLCLGGRCHRKVLDRYLVPVTSQFIIKWPTSRLGCPSSAASPHPRSLLASRTAQS
ncbi:Tubulin polyglutamylase TTLL7 [Merluccius polli]|uniref:Tubulin polyglutamylase TTLL7 n=1 Tax=Merluccius polli TaxID=89951 RepID=A0AA47N6M4_MERPO|nr:Tubulin polyglutamylase TTLL7 [Merluccius polli]